jgi:16S rRNA (cytidine1402-2'-O)-methyltransferase
LPDALRSLATALPDRRVAVCRELTKRFEEVVRGTAAAVTETFAQPPKGEITIVIDGASAEEARTASLEVAASAVRELVAAGRPRRAAVDLVAALSGQPRNALYDASL